MSTENPSASPPVSQSRMGPAQPLWRLAPTHGDDGRCLADFIMLIPGLGSRPLPCREQVALSIREVCASYGDQVAFADVNYALNVLWVSVAATPGLSGRIAQSIRRRVPDALLVGGQLAADSALPTTGPRRDHWWQCLRGLSQRAGLLLRGPGG